MSIHASQILHFLGKRALAHRLAPGIESTDSQVDGVCSLLPGAPAKLAFVTERTMRNQEGWQRTAATVVLVPPIDTLPEGPVCVIAVENPRLEYARISAEFFASKASPGIAASAVIDAAAEIGSNCLIGPGAYLGSGVMLGDDCEIGPNAVLLAGTRVGKGSRIGPSSTIGFDGFGYEREADGTPVKLPHFGGVRIGDFVEVGANSCIDKGTLDDTVIHNHVKVDNGVHIAHNCVVGEGSYIIAGVVLGGGTIVGPRSWVAPNSTVREKTVLGSDVIVGLASTVLADVPDGATVYGSPARTR